VMHLIQLYPRDWRERYEDEFQLLLAERPPDLRDRVDVVRAAVDAHLHPQVQREPGSPAPGPEPDGRSMSGRALGWITLAGGALWLVAMVVALNGPIVHDTFGDYRDGAAAAPFALLAIVLLSVGVFGVVRSLPRGAAVGAIGGAVSIIVGPIWAAMPWVIPLLVIASVGWVVLAVEARRVGAWRSLDAAIVLGGLVVAWALGAPFMMGLVASSLDSYAVFWLALTSVWIGVGHALLTADRRPALEPAPAERPAGES
jgi:hypothetical protein